MATSDLSLLRRSLLAMGIAVGGTAVFMGTCLLLASVALDRALPPPTELADRVDAEHEQPVDEAARVPAQPRS